MNIAKNLKNISWTALDKMTFVLYGIASVVLLRVTDSFELGLFTLFNNVHNLIFSIGYYIGFQSLLHFSNDKKQNPVINFYAILNATIIVVVLNALVIAAKYPLANIFNEEHLVDIIDALPIIMLLSIPRYFNVVICYRETKIARLFAINLIYFGSISGIIFYNVWNNSFLTHRDLINITYIGSALSVVVGTILNIKYWKFKLPNKDTIIKYKDIISYSAKFSIGSIALTIPRTLDAYVIQYFFGTNVVGLYAPAKTIFRFVEDLTTAIGLTIYSHTVKYFANNDMVNINKLVSKTISITFIFFFALTIFCWIFGSNLFELFLPARFTAALPIFNWLMLSSLFLSFTLLSTTINAEGKPELVSKYTLVAVIFWLISFWFVSVSFPNTIEVVAIPYIIFTFILSALFFNYAKKHYNLKLHQLFRFFSDTYNFVKDKIKNK
ncbi:MAG: lipopolysaccharide biosynthesis protein [Bacteroidetes bacterium]|nr:lipopolysaccharide biosynthesis protein [Bacteroidota bacterium]